MLGRVVVHRDHRRGDEIKALQSLAEYLVNLGGSFELHVFVAMFPVAVKR